MTFNCKCKTYRVLLSAVCAIILPWYLDFDGISYTNSLIPFAVALGIYMLLSIENAIEPARRMRKYTLVLGIILSSATSFGNYLESGENLPLLSLPMWLSILCYARVYSSFLCMLWTKLGEWEIRLQENTHGNSWIHRIANYILCRPWLVGLIIFLCWLPAYLAIFPGGFGYDADDEIKQLAEGFRDDFPKLHSAVITQLLSWSLNVFRSYTVGIAIYSIVQMCIISAIYTQMICTFNRRGINPILLLGILAFISLFPVYAMTANHTGRDMLFTTLLVYGIFLIYLMCIDPKRVLGRILPSIGVGVVLALAMLARNNSTGHLMLFIIITLLIIFCYKMRRRYLRGALILSGSLLSCYILVNILVSSVCQPCQPFQYKGGISFFTQAICRSYHVDAWSQEEKDEFAVLFNMNYTGYSAENADLSKFCLPAGENYTGDNYHGDLVKLWLKIGAEHPDTYVTAWMINSRSMWYPSVVIDGYNEIGLYEKYDKCYFAYSTKSDARGERQSILPEVFNFYHNIGLMTSFEKVPFLSMLFSIGFQYWILLNALFYVCYRRCRHIKIPLVFITVYVIILAFVPLIILRYFFTLFYLLPMIYIFTLQPLKSGD